MDDLTDTSAKLVVPAVIPIGPIVVARHGRPALDRRVGPKLTWQEYADWWDRYERGSLKAGQEAPDDLKALVIDAVHCLASPRPRAQETARLAAPGKTILTDDLFVEAPLPPPRWDKARYLPKTWNIFARLAWLRGHTFGGRESVSQARLRAQAAALRAHELSADGKVFIAAHGWFNRMLKPELKRLGWRCENQGGDRYWSYRVYTRKPTSED